MKTIAIMNFKNLSKQIAKFENEFLKDGDIIDVIEFTDNFTFKDKRSLTWGTETISTIRVKISNDEIFGDRIYKNISKDYMPEWKLIRESLFYREED